MYKINLPTEIQVFYNNREENSGQNYLVNLILDSQGYSFIKEDLPKDLSFNLDLERTLFEIERDLLEELKKKH